MALTVSRVKFFLSVLYVLAYELGLNLTSVLSMWNLHVFYRYSNLFPQSSAYASELNRRF